MLLLYALKSWLLLFSSFWARPILSLWQLIFHSTLTDLVSCRCQFTLSFRFSSIARYRWSRDCDKLVFVVVSSSKWNLKDEFSHCWLSSDFPTKESVFCSNSLFYSTISDAADPHPKNRIREHFLLFLLLDGKNKTFFPNNNYAQLFTQVELDFTHHPLSRWFCTFS